MKTILRILIGAMLLLLGMGLFAQPLESELTILTDKHGKYHIRENSAGTYKIYHCKPFVLDETKHGFVEYRNNEQYQILIVSNNTITYQKQKGPQITKFYDPVYLGMWDN